MYLDLAVYLDLDGVEADYDAGIRALGFAPDPSKKNELNRSGTKDPFKRKMYEAIQGTEFYRTLPLMPGAVELYRRVERYGPVVVTAAPKFGGTEDGFHVNPYWAGAAYHKRWWVEHVLLPAVRGYDPTLGSRPGTLEQKLEADRIPIPDERFVCTTSARKSSFMGRKHSEHQILIDDRRDNCIDWARAGGVAIFHTSAEETIAALDAYEAAGGPAGAGFVQNGGAGWTYGLDDLRTWAEMAAE